MKKFLRFVILGSAVAFVVFGNIEGVRLQTSAVHSFRVVDKQQSIGKYSGFTALWGYADNGNYICVPVPSLERYEIGKTYYFTLRNFDIENGQKWFMLKMFWGVITHSITIVIGGAGIIYLIYMLCEYAWKK